MTMQPAGQPDNPEQPEQPGQPQEPPGQQPTEPPGGAEVPSGTSRVVRGGQIGPPLPPDAFGRVPIDNLSLPHIPNQFYTIRAGVPIDILIYGVRNPGRYKYIYNPIRYPGYAGSFQGPGTGQAVTLPEGLYLDSGVENVIRQLPWIEQIRMHGMIDKDAIQGETWTSMILRANSTVEIAKSQLPDLSGSELARHVDPQTPHDASILLQILPFDYNDIPLIFNRLTWRDLTDNQVGIQHDEAREYILFMGLPADAPDGYAPSTTLSNGQKQQWIPIENIQEMILPNIRSNVVQTPSYIGDYADSGIIMRTTRRTNVQYTAGALRILWNQNFASHGGPYGLYQAAADMHRLVPFVLWKRDLVKEYENEYARLYHHAVPEPDDIDHRYFDEHGNEVNPGTTGFYIGKEFYPPYLPHKETGQPVLSWGGYVSGFIQTITPRGVMVDCTIECRTGPVTQPTDAPVGVERIATIVWPAKWGRTLQRVVEVGGPGGYKPSFIPVPKPEKRVRAGYNDDGEYVGVDEDGNTRTETDRTPGRGGAED